MVANSTKALKDRLKQAMNERGVKVPQLAEATGIPKDRIYKWYKEGTNPKADDAAILEKWIKGESIIGEIENPPPSDEGYKEKYYALLEDQVSQLKREITELKELIGYLKRLEKNQVMIASAQRAYQEFWAVHYPPKRMTAEDVNDAIDSRALELAEIYLSEGIELSKGS